MHSGSASFGHYYALIKDVSSSESGTNSMTQPSRPSSSPICSGLRRPVLLLLGVHAPLPCCALNRRGSERGVDGRIGKRLSTALSRCHTQVRGRRRVMDMCTPPPQLKAPANASTRDEEATPLATWPRCGTRPECGAVYIAIGAWQPRCRWGCDDARQARREGRRRERRDIGQPFFW